MGKFVDLTGRKFGRLTVIERDCNDRKTGAYWICKCDCGNYSVVASCSLKNGKTVSCGCYGAERAGVRNVTHGKCNTKLYGIWRSMKRRCCNPKDINYRYYGGKGVKVCDEWISDFQKFYDWSVSNGYTEGLSIDRIDVDGWYCPENCRWITHAEQLRNTSRNVRITYCGETYTLSQWGEITGYGKRNVRERIFRYGWSIEDALSTPVGTFYDYKKQIKNINPS